MYAGTHTEVVAERKFGKSSLLRCLEAALRDEESTVAIYVPVNYLNCSRWQDFYAWLTAHVLAGIGKRTSGHLGYLAQRLSHKHPNFAVGESDPNEIFSQLGQVDVPNVVSRLQCLLNVLTDMGISIVLLLDEISAALSYFDGDSQRFQYLRQLAMSDGSVNCKPLTVCIADRSQWQLMIPQDGRSPGLNFISNHVRLAGIPKEDARLLLQEHGAECTLLCLMPPAMVEMVLYISGTYPYYLKVAGEKAYQQLIVSGRLHRNSLQRETYMAVRGHLSRYLSACDSLERKVLSRVITSLVSVSSRDIALWRLYDRGLLRIQDGVFLPFNELFRSACEEFL
jgi:hypothetical protein